MQRRTFILAATAAAAGALAAAPAMSFAKDWPSQPLKLVVGYPGGSTPDMVARTLSAPLSKALGVPVIVENKPGASGNIAAEYVARATDSHTLGIVINGNLTSSPMLYANLPYDPAKDFSYLSLLTTAPLVLVAPASEPSGAAFFEKARKEGDKWNYGTVGVGSVSHLGMELLKADIHGLDPLQIPYNGGSPAVITAMIGGQVQMALMSPGTALPQVKAGKLKAIGVTSDHESDIAPGIPPIEKVANIKDFNLEVWTALVGPASLPQADQKRVTDIVNTALKDPDIQKKLLIQGWQAVGTTPQEMRTRVEKETKILGAIIKSQHIRLQ